MYINHLDTCYPDYFQGSPHAVYGVSVGHNMTYQDLLEGLLEAYNSSCDDITLSSEGFKTLADDCFSTVVLTDVFFRLDASELADKNEPLSEDYTVMAYFALVLDDTDNG